MLTLDQSSRRGDADLRPRAGPADDPSKLGDWPFEIGLWVGKSATPNRMGHEGRQRPDSARPRTIALPERRPQALPDPYRKLSRGAGRSSSRHPSNSCPTPNEPTDLRVLRECRCDFTRATRRCPSWRLTSPSIAGCRASLSRPSTSSRPCRGWAGRGVLRPVDALTTSRLLRALRDRRRGQRCPATPAAARPHHPGRAAPDLRSARHDGRALRDGPGRRLQP